MAALKDKTVIVTGAAGGIGRAIAEEAGRAGARLALVDTNAARLDETATAIATHCLLRRQTYHHCYYGWIRCVKDAACPRSRTLNWGPYFSGCILSSKVLNSLVPTLQACSSENPNPLTSSTNVTIPPAMTHHHLFHLKTQGFCGSKSFIPGSFSITACQPSGLSK